MFVFRLSGESDDDSDDGDAQKQSTTTIIMTDGRVNGRWTRAPLATRYETLRGGRFSRGGSSSRFFASRKIGSS